MKKLFSLVIGAIGSSLIFSGCSAEAGGAAGEAIGERAEAICPYTGADGMLVLLANAMAKELGRWELTTDFYVTVNQNTNQQELRLRQGVNCWDGCPTIKQILAFQDGRLDQKFRFPDGSKLNSWQFAARLVAGYNDMLTCERNTWPPSSCRYEQHRLTFVSTGTGPCSALNQFDAQTPTGGNLGSPANLRNALLFTRGGNSFDNAHLAFSSSATSVSIGTSLEFEPGPPNPCSKYSVANIENASCSCGVGGSKLKHTTSPKNGPAIPYMYSCW